MATSVRRTILMCFPSRLNEVLLAVLSPVFFQVFGVEDLFIPDTTSSFVEDSGAVRSSMWGILNYRSEVKHLLYVGQGNSSNDTLMEIIYQC